MLKRAALVAALAIVVAAILFAGLAPFELDPPNDAHWGPEGLHFGGRGLARLEDALAWEAGDAALLLSQRK